MTRLQTTPGTAVVLPKQVGTSGFAIAGLVFSILGWLTCGLLCIIGAPLSFLALFDRGPKGVAVAGLIVGFPGVLFFIVIGASLCTAALGVRDAAKKQAELQAKSSEQQIENGAAEETTSNLPPVKGDPPFKAKGNEETTATHEEENSEKHQSRIWTDLQGKFTVEATFYGIADRSDVFLKKSDGKVIRVPIDKLSEQDKQWLKTHAKWKPTEK